MVNSRADAGFQWKYDPMHRTRSPAPVTEAVAIHLLEEYKRAGDVDWWCSKSLARRSARKMVGSSPKSEATALARRWAYDTL